MAARLCCQLDSSRDVVLLRPFGSESGGPAVSRPSAGSASRADSPLPSAAESHLPLGRLPACFASPSGPCCLGFTCAEFGAMVSTMNFVTWHAKRQLGMPTKDLWTPYVRNQLLTKWEEGTIDSRLPLFVLGGCRHKYM
uniref:Protein X n=1 Tax=Arctic squirrel hepatitis virus TaxID=41952 RepID=X_ASHV|nr:RecName: Full=Protein X; AltName: Full=HBx; AltName: Full=Peptide X; AltName: Full=pX [Arctic ground squirrel hepatitis B virus]AAB08036.1 X protein [Arctic ground squirrel hepatitis B virus]